MHQLLELQSYACFWWIRNAVSYLILWCDPLLAHIIFSGHAPNEKVESELPPPKNDKGWVTKQHMFVTAYVKIIMDWFSFVMRSFLAD